MAKIVLERLPPHWMYVPSRRRVRAFFERLGANVRLIEYRGAAYRPREA